MQAIVGCGKTAKSVRYPGTTTGFLAGKPPYSVVTMTSVSVVQYSTVTSYPVFNIDYDKNVPGTADYICPHCQEKVRITNVPPLSSDELKRVTEERNRPHRVLGMEIPKILKGSPSAEQEYGYIIIENSQGHRFLYVWVGAGYMLDLGYESKEPAAPGSRFQTASKIIHRIGP